MGDTEKVDHQIAEAVQRLVKAKPDAKPRIAQLLGIVEALVTD